MIKIVGSFELGCLAILMLLDTIIGYIRSIFIEHDFDVSYSIRGIVKKLCIFLLCGGIASILILGNHMKIFTIQLQEFITLAFNGIIILACYSELVSVLSQVTIITGIDFSKVPAVKNAIEEKEKEGK